MSPAAINNATAESAKPEHFGMRVPTQVHKLFFFHGESESEKTTDQQSNREGVREGRARQTAATQTDCKKADSMPHMHTCKTPQPRQLINLSERKKGQNSTASVCADDAACSSDDHCKETVEAKQHHATQPTRKEKGGFAKGTSKSLKRAARNILL